MASQGPPQKITLHILRLCLLDISKPSQTASPTEDQGFKYLSILRTFHTQTSSKPSCPNGLLYRVDELTLVDPERVQMYQQNKLFSCFKCLILAWITVQPYITSPVCHEILSR